MRPRLPANRHSTPGHHPFLGGASTMRREGSLWLWLSSLVVLLLIVSLFASPLHVAGVSHASPGTHAAKAESESIAHGQVAVPACCANSKAGGADSCCVQKPGKVQVAEADDRDPTVAVAFAEPEKAKAAKVELETTEGCECVAPCPCASIAPASFDHCRALKFYQVQTGEVDRLDLKGLVFVAAIADSPKKMYELRDWKGGYTCPRAKRRATKGVASRC